MGHLLCTGVVKEMTAPIEPSVAKETSTLYTAFVVITLTTAVATAGVAVADLIPAQFVLANSAEVGVPRSWLPPLAAVKLAGTVGLVAGLVGLPTLGTAAAVGLVLFFVGAVVTHLRAHVLYNIAFPGAYLCLSAATLALMVGR
jgi:DoxX-like family